MDGKVVDVDPWAAMFNPSTWPETTHMILAAFMVTGFVRRERVRGRRCCAAAATATTGSGLLRAADRRARSSRPSRSSSGDWAAAFVAEHQPVKLAAHGGAVPTPAAARRCPSAASTSTGELRYAIEIPHGLSLLVAPRPERQVAGPGRGAARPTRPPVNVVHLSFDTMVGIGFALLALGAWFGLVVVAAPGPAAPRWFLRAVAVSGVGRGRRAGGRLDRHRGRPPAVDRLRRACAPPTRSARRPACGCGFFAVIVVYVVLTVATVVRAAAAGRDATPVPRAPQEADVRERRGR